MPVPLQDQAWQRQKRLPERRAAAHSGAGGGSVGLVAAVVESNSDAR